MLPIRLPPEQQIWFQEMRRIWCETVQPFDGFAVSEVFTPLRPLLPRNTVNCALLPSRVDMLEHIGKNIVCAEIGTEEGRFASEIWQRCRPREFHIYDLDFAPYRAADLLPSVPEIVLHEGDSSTELAASPDGHFDFIYIDGDHSYDGVRKDIAAATKKIKLDGIIAFNDYIYWSYVEHMPYGVPHAVNELCADDDWEMIYFCLNPSMYFDVAVKRIPVEA
jgi:hypothetical protein